MITPGDRLKKYLHNRQLIRALCGKVYHQNTMCRLSAVLELLHPDDVSEATMADIVKQYKEHKRLWKYFDDFITKKWRIGDWWERAILKYIGYSDEEIDNLLDYVSD